LLGVRVDADEKGSAAEAVDEPEAAVRSRATVKREVTSSSVRDDGANPYVRAPAAVGCDAAADADAAADNLRPKTRPLRQVDDAADLDIGQPRPSHRRSPDEVTGSRRPNNQWTVETAITDQAELEGDRGRPAAEPSRVGADREGPSGDEDRHLAGAGRTGKLAAQTASCVEVPVQVSPSAAKASRSSRVSTPGSGCAGRVPITITSLPITDPVAAPFASGVSAKPSGAWKAIRLGAGSLALWL